MEEIEKEEPVITVQKAKLKDGFLTAEYTVVDNEIMTKYAAEFMRFAHEDLINRFKNLVPHLCLITEQIRVPALATLLESTEEKPLVINEVGELENLLDPSRNQLDRVDQALQEQTLADLLCFANFRCTGFVNSNSGVMLLGQKVLKSGKVLNLLTPLTNLEEFDYDFAGALQWDLEMAIKEVILHINGKGTGGQQLDLFNQSDKAA